MSAPAAAFLASLPPFVPRRGLANGHVMTVMAWARKRDFPALPAPESRLVRVTDDSRILAHCYWQPDRSGRPTVVALHGLEGSSGSHYMRGLADKAFRRGWNAVLVNQRNCGGTEHLAPGLYHSGLTSDPRIVIDELAARDRVGPIGIVGYSLGGNLSLKLAGELGDDTASPVAAVVTVSPTIDLDRCVRAIDQRRNVVYHWNFVRNLRARMRRKAALWPGAYDLTGLDRIWTIRRFDDAYTAPHHGFGGASDYYHRASALRVIDRIRRPTLILTADDDPFVPPDQFRDPAVRANPHILVRVERGGGHCAFIAAATEDFDGYWAERTAIGYLDAVIGRT